MDRGSRYYEYAGRCRDLIVIGTHGRRGIRRLVMEATRVYRAHCGDSVLLCADDGSSKD